MDQVPAAVVPEPAPVAEQDVPPLVPDVPTLERAVRDRHGAGHSQRAIARDLNIDRRRVKRIIEQAAYPIPGRPAVHVTTLEGSGPGATELRLRRSAAVFLVRGLS